MVTQVYRFFDIDWTNDTSFRGRYLCFSAFISCYLKLWKYFYYYLLLSLLLSTKVPYQFNGSAYFLDSVNCAQLKTFGKFISWSLISCFVLFYLHSLLFVNNELIYIFHVSNFFGFGALTTKLLFMISNLPGTL